jgi:cytochrome c oxidase cbb3-type subunit III
MNRCIALLTALWLGAVPAAHAAQPAAAALISADATVTRSETTQADPARVARGKSIMSVNCAFCHGVAGRGTGVAPDLMQSPVLKLDTGNGANLGSFLQVGRPARGMPAFASLTVEQTSDLAAYLRSQYQAAQSAAPQLSILVGDARRGASYFSVHCATCHRSDVNSLQGIGSRYDDKTLQARILNPRARGSAQAPLPKNIPITVVVATDKDGRATGELVRLTDFFVTLRDPGGMERTFLRQGDTPEVELRDPLQAHLDLMRVFADRDLHDVTAYLAGLK